MVAVTDKDLEADQALLRLEGTRRNESLPPQERYRLVLPSCVDADCDRPIVTLHEIGRLGE